MSKFCIELEGMMLPDAIAAVVEDWYDAQDVNSAGALQHKPQLTASCQTNSGEFCFYKSCFYKSINFDNYDYQDSPWKRLLRITTFIDCEEEWSIGPRWGDGFYQPRLTYVDSKGRSRWVLLPFEWSVKNANAIRDYAQAITEWVEDGGETLANAYKRVKSFWELHDVYPASRIRQMANAETKGSDGQSKSNGK